MGEGLALREGRETMKTHTSIITSRGRTTVPKEVRAALSLRPGDKLIWEIRDGRVVVTSERPLLWELEGFLRHGKSDAMKAVAAARKRRGRI